MIRPYLHWLAWRNDFS